MGVIPLPFIPSRQGRGKLVVGQGGWARPPCGQGGFSLKIQLKLHEVKVGEGAEFTSELHLSG